MFYNTGISTYIWIVTNRKEKSRRGKIQLFDAREIYLPMRRSLGDKRRKIGDGEDGEPNQIADIVKAYGSQEEWRLAEWFDRNDKRLGFALLSPGQSTSFVPEGARLEVNVISRFFDNADFGYTRVTVERPLRLRYQMDSDRKARFLDACPHLLDDIQAIDEELDREPRFDWNAVAEEIEALLKKRKSRWKAPEHKLFRSVFTGLCCRNSNGDDLQVFLRCETQEHHSKLSSP